MCTLAAWLRPGHDVPLVVFANRDERLDRPSAPPQILPGAPRILAPLDLQEGGTWLGLNEHGLFVGITNRAGAPRDASRSSRGSLVRDALTAPSADALRDRLDTLTRGEHNPFHLLYADRDQGFLTWDDDDAIHHAELAPGLSIVTEQGHAWDHARPLGARDSFVRRAWEALAPVQRADLRALLGLLALHGDSPLDGACVHADTVGYGTRSSLALAVGRDLAGSKALWIEGKPCTAAPVDLAPALAALR